MSSNTYTCKRYSLLLLAAAAATRSVSSFTSSICTANKHNRPVVLNTVPNQQRNNFHALFGSSSSLTSSSSKSKSNISLENLSSKNILVIGGSGRVGGSVVCQLTKHNANVMVGGTKLESFQQSQARWKQLFPQLAPQFDSITFHEIDREDDASIAKLLMKANDNDNDIDNDNTSNQKIDLVVHTAGPFQGKVNSPNGVIKACVEHGVGYIDVCDDYCTARAAKAKYTQTALGAGTSTGASASAATGAATGVGASSASVPVPCILSTGCWPGVSSLMAKQLTQSVLEKRPHLKPEDLTVDFNFFTAGR